MREILFRGKRIDNSIWVYGDLRQYSEKTKGIFDYTLKHTVRVNPDTVGQYTGLTDKNGKKIFEGDIIKHFNNSNDVYDIGAIYWDADFIGWRRTTKRNFHSHIIDSYKLNPTCEYEVIGNIHDNPELLEV